MNKKGLALLATAILLGSVLGVSLTIIFWPRGGNFVITAETFSSVWDTRNPGVSESNQVKLPLQSSGTYSFLVDWGDGTTSVITSWNQAEATHTYALEGVYTININGVIAGWSFNDEGDEMKLLEIKQWGNLRLGNSGGYFWGCSNLNITAIDSMNLTGTTNLASAFRGCDTLDVVQGINDWDVSSITNVSYMFYRADIFNQNISSWNVSSVRFMMGMFENAFDFNQDIGSWDVSSVTDMSYMFYTAHIFNQNIDSWDVSSVRDMSYIFAGAYDFNQYIGSWDVSSVIDMNYMFLNANAFDQSIGSWTCQA